MTMLSVGNIAGAELYLVRPGSVQAGVPQYWFDDDGTSLTVQAGQNPVQVRRMGHRSDTFDSQKVGDVPAGWKLDTAAGGMSVQNVSASTDKCEMISDNSATAGSSMSRSFDPQSGKIRVEASVRQEAKNHGMEMALNPRGGLGGRLSYFLQSSPQL